MDIDLKDYDKFCKARLEFAGRKKPESGLDLLEYTIESCNLDYWSDYHLWYHCFICGGDRMDKDHQKRWFEFWKSGHKDKYDIIG